MPENLLVELIENSIWMGWNAMLAFLPFLLALFLFKPKKRRHRSILWTAGFILFILFLPNAPYLFTDVIHIYDEALMINSRSIFLVVLGQYTLLFFAGFWLFGASYRRFENFIAKKWPTWQITLLRATSFLIVSTGVYLGRFPRFNSWDALTQPVKILKEIYVLFSLHAMTFIVLYSLILFAAFFLYSQFKISKKK